MPKIQTIDRCEQCFQNFEIDMYSFQYYCKRMKREIEYPEEIPEWCELEDAEKEITGIPCSHVAPECGHFCEKCGDFLGC